MKITHRMNEMLPLGGLPAYCCLDNSDAKNFHDSYSFFFFHPSYVPGTVLSTKHSPYKVSCRSGIRESGCILSHRTAPLCR